MLVFCQLFWWVLGEVRGLRMSGMLLAGPTAGLVFKILKLK